jgi:hypothetical protein
MHMEIESRDGPERWHGGLLPPRLGDGLRVLGSQGGGVGA